MFDDAAVVARGSHADPLAADGESTAWRTVQAGERAATDLFARPPDGGRDRGD